MKTNIRINLNITNVLLVAIALRVIVYFFVNVLLYGYENFGHPDSYFYHYITLELRELWNSGNFSVSRYPEYTNITALLYYLPIPNRLGPEILNLCAAVFTVYLGYLTVLHVTKEKTAAVIAALILAVDPYMIYLSTQYLRDTLLIMGTALLVYGSCHKRLESSLVGTLVLGLLRPLQALTFVPLILLTNKRRAALVLLVPIVSIVLASSITWGVNLTEEIPIPPNAVPNSGPHIEFFSRVNHNAISYRDPLAHWDILINPYSYVKSTINFFLFPNPFHADTTVERGFAAHIIFWYTIFTFGFVGLLCRPQLPREFKVFLISGIILGALLVLTSESQGPFVRWRLQLYYLMIPALSLGIYYLKDYEVRKRFFDILLSALFFVLLLPLSTIISCVLKFTQGRVIFKQERIGFEGETFTIYKFVTMKPNSDGRALTDDNDQRVTKVGVFLRKTTLDEIPSLLNVLKGDMSVVGPRPLATWEHETCKRSIHYWHLRYQVKPGMIGLAQLETDRRDNKTKLAYDVLYINKRSHLTDLKIFLKGITYNLNGRWR